MDAAIDLSCRFGGSEKQETELMACGISGGTSMKAPQLNFIPVCQDQWRDNTMGKQQVFFPTGIATWTIHFKSDSPPPEFIGQWGQKLFSTRFGDGSFRCGYAPGRHSGNPEKQDKPSKCRHRDEDFSSHVFSLDVR